MPLVFICNDGAAFTDYPHAPGATDIDITRQYSLCASGQGQWMDVAALGVSPSEPPPVGSVTPEQALVQVAVVGTGLLAAMKGLAVGMMR